MGKREAGEEGEGGEEGEPGDQCADQPMSFIRELKGEVIILIAILRKETRAYDLAMAV